MNEWTKIIHVTKSYYEKPPNGAYFVNVEYQLIENIRNLAAANESERIKHICNDISNILDILS